MGCSSSYQYNNPINDGIMKNWRRERIVRHHRKILLLGFEGCGVSSLRKYLYLMYGYNQLSSITITHTTNTITTTIADNNNNNINITAIEDAAANHDVIIDPTLKIDKQHNNNNDNDNENHNNNNNINNINNNKNINKNNKNKGYLDNSLWISTTKTKEAEVAVCKINDLTIVSYL